MCAQIIRIKFTNYHNNNKTFKRMKKIITLLLVFTACVSTASAWGTLYLNCDDNSWGNGSSLPFTWKDTNSYYYVLSGSHVNNGDFYFRFYAGWDNNNGGNYVMPNTNGDVVSSEVYSTNVVWDTDDGSRAFKIEQNALAKAVIIYVYYEDSAFKLYTEVLTNSYTVAFVNKDSWSNVYAYSFDARTPEIKVLGAWPGTKLESTDGIYRVEIPYSSTTKVIFNNNNDIQTGDLDLNDDALYDTNGKIENQSVSINTYGMSTFCSEYPLDFSTASPAGLKAYRITAAADGTLEKEEVTKVPANTGVYVEGTASQDYTVAPTATAAAIGTNMLVPGTGATISQTDGDYTNFILTVNKDDGTADTPKFFKVNTEGNTVPAGKAYLQIPTANAARDFFWFDDDVTAINAVTNNQKTDGQAYNLAGQRIAQPTKGLYIVNGKKYIVK